MAFCPANCSDNTLISNDPGNCDLQPRKRNIDRFGFFLCSTDLPTPFNCAALQALYNAGELVFSSQLCNIEIADPVKEELSIADCLPPLQMVTARTINFQDRIAVVKSNTSPWTGGNKNFYDFDFWADKKAKNFRLRYLIVYCDGTTVVAKDENGNPMIANLDIFLSQERQGSGGNSYILEIKKGSLTFKGDPLDFTNKPEEDGAGNVFDITQCSFWS